MLAFRPRTFVRINSTHLTFWGLSWLATTISVRLSLPSISIYFLVSCLIIKSRFSVLWTLVWETYRKSVNRSVAVSIHSPDVYNWRSLNLAEYTGPLCFAFTLMASTKVWLAASFASVGKISQFIHGKTIIGTKFWYKCRSIHVWVTSYRTSFSAKVFAQVQLSASIREALVQS